ncbi:MAG: DUF4340 domain-containing protein [Gammaproteobacteria bacterium]
MNSRTLLNLVLLGIVALLVVLVVYEPGKEAEPQAPRLTALKKDSISKIDIQRSGGETVRFVRDKNIWHMTAPYQLPANEFRINSILRLAEMESHARHELEGLDRADFKLTQPEVVVTFDDQVNIKFGGSEPLNHHRYVEVDGMLHLISDTVYYHVSGKPTALLSLQLLPQGTVIQAIELPDNRLELKDGRWQIKNEPADMASDAVTRLLNEWRLAQALDVVAATQPPGRQQVKIFVEGQDTPVVFSIVQRKPDFVLLREDKGVQYQLTEDSAERLLRLASTDVLDEDALPPPAAAKP